MVIDGGAHINGVNPLEDHDWMPAEPTPALRGKIPREATGCGWWSN
jgi:hypothetical protein